MSQQVSGARLRSEVRQEALDRFIYRMTVESVRRWPEAARQMYAGGFRLPLITDLEWLERTTFTVRKDGRLNNAVHCCHTVRP
jgi:hypothetical protein